ncbi:GntR family transcriptional regulator [Burkholderia cepacia]|nr:GntR family transcriptional regulator [Burkholderia cepacia]
MAALADPDHAVLPQVLRSHSENTAREVLAILDRTGTADAPEQRSAGA